MTLSPPTPPRRAFIATATAAAACTLIPRPAAARAERSDPDRFPTTDPDLASEFVGACHARLDRVRELLAVDAGLAKASWDWGFGDWETAIGAASHTGRTDIIEVLLAHGARPTIFTLATLDQADAIRAIIEAMPHARQLEGPHSISLYAHARAGKAQRVLEYLDGAGITATDPFTTDRAKAEPYLGTYAWGPREPDRFVIGWNDRLSTVTITRPDRPGRNLMAVGEHAFSPAGARHTLIRFELSGGTAAAMSVTGFGEPLRASRAPA